MDSEIFMDVSAELAHRGEQHGTRPFLGQWSHKHWMNTPGPLYCGQTDNCGIGPILAPENVHVYTYGYEIIYRQPINRIELEQVLDAANCDPFQGYAMDGDAHWTYEAIKDWWSRRDELLAEIGTLHNQWANKSEAEHKRFQNGVVYTNDYAFYYQKWQIFLLNNAHEYLQIYAFFLQNGHIPAATARLPDI